MKIKKAHLLILIALLPCLHGCEKYPENPNRPILPYPIKINIYEYQYQNLRFVSGWEYITAPIESTSRGLIVYRYNDNEFFVYDRMPPNEPNTCTDSQGNTTRMVMDFPFVVDHCNNAYYNILNGQLIVREPDMVPDFPTDGTTIFPLIQYHTQFDGHQLIINN